MLYGQKSHWCFFFNPTNCHPSGLDAQHGCSLPYWDCKVYIEYRRMCLIGNLSSLFACNTSFESNCTKLEIVGPTSLHELHMACSGGLVTNHLRPNPPIYIGISQTGYGKQKYQHICFPHSIQLKMRGYGIIFIFISGFQKLMLSIGPSPLAVRMKVH